MTKGELLKMMEKIAVEYCNRDVLASLKRNSHMNEYKGEVITQDTIEALIVDFVNYVGNYQGINYGLKTCIMSQPMKCTIVMSDKKLKKFFGKEISAEEFADFCKDAIASKMFLRQFTDNKALKER